MIKEPLLFTHAFKVGCVISSCSAGDALRLTRGRTGAAVLSEITATATCDFKAAEMTTLLLPEEVRLMSTVLRAPK